MAAIHSERQQTVISLRITVYHARYQLRSHIAKFHSDHRETGKVLGDRSKDLILRLEDEAVTQKYG